MSLYKPDADLELSSIKAEKGKWFYVKPKVNFNPAPFWAMPPTIDPKNWTPITSEEQRAHNERQMIRGRLRREMWSKAYHPEHWKHFSTASDLACVRFNRIKTVWHVKESMKWSDRRVRGTSVLFLLTLGAFGVTYYDVNKPVQSIVQRIGRDK